MSDRSVATKVVVWREWALWFAVLAAVTVGMHAGRDRLNEAHVTIAYLLIVQVASARAGRRLGIALAIVAFLSFDLFFLPPFNTLTIQNPFDWLVLVAFLGTGILSAQLLHRADAEAELARARAVEIDRLAALGAHTLNAGRAEDALAAIVAVIRASLPIDECVVYAADQRGDSFVTVARSGGEPEPASSDSLVPWVATQGANASIHADATARVDRAGEGLTDVRAEDALVSLLRPLRVRSETVGVLRISKASGLVLTSDDARVLEALSFYAALGVERVRLAAEAERAALLQETHRAKDAVLASVSHDLRTPLTTIKGLAHEIAATGDDRAAVIEEEADRLTTFVAQLLDLSRINAGRAVQDIQPNEAEDLLGAAAQRVAGRLEGHELRFHVARDDALLFGRFDFSQTLRALVNLIENAAKYSPAAAPIDVSAYRRGAKLEFAVADRGSGIPVHESTRIFEPFYRIGGPPDSAGAGLGLPIARGIAEAQGGSLIVEARDGGGTVFRLAVPALSEHEVAGGPAPRDAVL